MRLLLEVLGAVERFLGRRRATKAKQTEVHRLAVSSVLSAILATERYLFEQGEGHSPDGERESSLAQLWSRAAVDVHAVDRRLSRIAMLTSFTWANPKLLERPEYERVPEQLELIRRQCEWLLDHWE
jgi:hypothetical protein